MRVVWCIAVVVGLAGCPKARLSDEEIALRAALAAVDAAWDARAGEDGLGPVRTAMAAIPELSRDDGRVLWRVARLAIAEGLVVDDPHEARRHYAQAREAGLRCVGRDPLVTTALRDGTELTFDTPVEPLLASCAAWSAYAWARWLTTFEEAATTLDHPRVKALAEAGDGAEGGAAAARRAQILVDLVWPEILGGDPAEARDELRAAYRPRRAEAWVWWEDVTRWIVQPDDLTPPRDPPVTPEEWAAARRMRTSR